MVPQSCNEKTGFQGGSNWQIGTLICTFLIVLFYMYFQVFCDILNNITSKPLYRKLILLCIALTD